MARPYYVLWHLETGNAIGGWSSLKTACEQVLAEIATNDDEDMILLECGDEDDE